jgi:hypothetical protein
MDALAYVVCELAGRKPLKHEPTPEQTPRRTW